MRLLSGLLVGLGLVLGCGGDDGVSPAETARAELADRGIAYTERVFLDAARHGALAVVRLFVQAGMDVNAADEYGWTALYFAAWKGHLEMVQYLVGQGASVRATGINGWTPRDVAAHCSTSRLYGSSAMANCGAVVEYFDSL